MAKFPKRLSEVPHVLSVSSQEIPYGLSYSRKRRTLSIQVNPQGKVKVYAPSSLPEQKIRDFLNQKARWILEKRTQALERFENVKIVNYRTGEDFLFLGNKYPLHIQQGTNKRPVIHFDGNAFQVKSGADTVEPKRVRELLVKWYILQAKEIFGARLFHFSRILNTSFLKVTIRAQKTIWGSCHAHKRAIHLNWRLVMAPVSVIDYVVVHELCHLFFPNHSKRFWNKVKTVFPDYKKELMWLKEHAEEMVLPDANH